jgi:hypothetical protein
MAQPPTVRWLILVHQVPAKPDYLRIKVRRRLGQLGAAAIKNSVYVLPSGDANRAGLAALARDILRAGGEALVCESQLLEGLSDGAAEDLLRAARDAEYTQLAATARRLTSGLRGGSAGADARRRRAGQALERLRERFEQVVARDAGGARGRHAAAGALSLLEDLVQGVEEAGAGEPRTPGPPNGATWVTRSGVMVDRIASAWLIRRFIDPGARFKFVNGRGFRARPDELRFDMAEAEFTHVQGRCTFEELIERFQLRDSALRPIAEIVHDLDLEDGRYRRPEAAGVDRVIVGLAIAKQSDEARCGQGAALFESLYESFRTQPAAAVVTPRTHSRRSTR